MKAPAVGGAMAPWVPTLLSVAIISVVSLVGLLTLPFDVLRKHAVLFSLIALAAGTLIGDAFFHLLPEAVELWGAFTPTVGFLLVGGFLAFYILESVLRWGHAHGEAAHASHDLPSGSALETGPKGTIAEKGAAVAAAIVTPPVGKIKAFGVLNLVGDALHNFLDGIVVAAGFLVDVPTGIATTIAVAMHEIPQEFGDFGVLLRAGFRPLQAAAFNLGSALFAMGGAVLLLALPFEAQTIQKLALPVVAGGFLYIAAADLIPELHHHTRARYVPGVVGLLVVGLALMASLTLLE